MHAAANAVTTLNSSSPFRHSCALLAKALILACCLVPHANAQMQSGTAPAQPPQPNPRNPTPAPQTVAPVTTTVIVHGEVQDDYLPESVTVGTLGGASLKETPLSATVITRDLLNDQVSRLLSDV